jgi:D-amino-acid oxidase
LRKTWVIPTLQASGSSLDQFKILKDAAEVPGEWPEGYIYSSYVLNAPLYLQHLHKNLVAKGVPVIRKRITSLDELYNLPEVGPVDTVINASGLGARSLLGVEDREAYPIRGQTVLVRSDVKVCLMGTVRSPDKGTHKKPSESFYIIPRPGSANAVIVGGCFQEDNFDPMPDYALAQRILERAYAACPELAGPNGQLWRDIEIISHNVGFRPARHGGCRLELEERDLGVRRDLAPRSSEPARKVAVLRSCLLSIHPRAENITDCYGIGPAGYQASLGLAKEAADIFERHRAALN